MIIFKENIRGFFECCESWRSGLKILFIMIIYLLWSDNLSLWLLFIILHFFLTSFFYQFVLIIFYFFLFQRKVFPKDYYVVHHYTRSMLCDTDPVSALSDKNRSLTCNECHSCFRHIDFSVAAPQGCPLNVVFSTRLLFYIAHSLV